MTQDLLDQPESTQVSDASTTEDFGWGAETNSADFNYTPVSPWAMAAVAVSVCGLTAFLGIFGIVVAVAGVVLSIAAISQIRSQQGAVTGMKLAALGLVLSVGSVAGGISSQIYHYRTEVPEGYLRVSFPNDISAHEFVMYRGGQRRLTPEVKKLVGEKIFVKGFMWQTQQDEGLDSFVFLKDNGECCFGGSPQQFDKMHVIMQDGKLVDGHNGMISIAGVLRADVTADEDGAVYTLEADMVEPSRTRF